MTVSASSLPHVRLAVDCMGGDHGPSVTLPACRAFLDKHVAPHHEQWEKDKIVDRGVWLEAGKQGFLGMSVPEEYGGGGAGMYELSLVMEEMSANGCALLMMVVSSPLPNRCVKLGSVTASTYEPGRTRTT